MSMAGMTQINKKGATSAEDRTIKERMAYKGSQQENGYIKRRLGESSVALNKSIMLKALIDAHAELGVITCNIPIAFIPAPMPKIKDGEERVMMEMTGVLVNVLVKLNPELYGPYVVYEKNRKVLYIQLMRAIYGM
jgi:hypothetical protein